MLHSAWHAVTPPVTIVLLLDAKLQDLAMHTRAVPAEEYLGSQLMPLTVESVYKMFTLEFHWPKEHVNGHIHSPATNPVCVVWVCVWISPWGSMRLLSSLWTYVYLTPMTGVYVQTSIAIQTRTVNKQEDLAPEGGLLTDVDLHEDLPHAV